MRSYKLLESILQHGVWVLLLVVWVLFSLQSDSFATLSNLSNTCLQASSAALVAIGMTFVLLTAGVDLSVGSIMFVCAAVAGRLAINDTSFFLCIASMVIVGLGIGMINAMVITRFKIIPFIATLAMLYIGRGTGLWLTDTRAINLSDEFLRLGSLKLFGIPLPILIVAAVAAIGQIVLSRTTLGKHIMAVGHNRESAEMAGVNSRRVILLVYAVAGLLAGAGAVISLSQLGSVSPTFGENREFTAIAAAVIGGTSLFGGRGSVFPGTIIGALLIQSVENGLVMLNADPYLYPMIVSGIIFVAVLVDGVRMKMLSRAQRRSIYGPTR